MGILFGGLYKMDFKKSAIVKLDFYGISVLNKIQNLHIYGVGGIRGIEVLNNDETSRYWLQDKMKFLLYLKYGRKKVVITRCQQLVK